MGRMKPPILIRDSQRHLMQLNNLTVSKLCSVYSSVKQLELTNIHKQNHNHYFFVFGVEI